MKLLYVAIQWKYLQVKFHQILPVNMGLGALTILYSNESLRLPTIIIFVPTLILILAKIMTQHALIQTILLNILYTTGTVCANVKCSSSLILLKEALYVYYNCLIHHHFIWSSLHAQYIMNGFNKILVIIYWMSQNICQSYKWEVLNLKIGY